MVWNVWDGLTVTVVAEGWASAPSHIVTHSAAVPAIVIRIAILLASVTAHRRFICQIQYLRKPWRTFADVLQRAELLDGWYIIGMAPKPVGLRRAVAHLESLIRQAEPTRGFVLPPLSSLANSASVSRMTMYKAVSLLKRSGALVSSGSRGIMVAGAIPAMAQAPCAPVLTPQAPSTRWRTVKQKISAQLLNATLPAGRLLPSRKELLRRFDIGPATLRRALRELEADGRLVRVPRGYRAPGLLASSARGATVLFVTHTSDATQIPILTPRMPDTLRELERECLSRGLRLLLRSFDQVRSTGPSAGSSDPVLGAVMTTIAPYRERFLGALSAIDAAGLPCCLIDESMPDDGLRSATSRPLQRVWALGTGPVAGELMGRHLLALGHSRVAYLSRLPETETTSPRLRGLRCAFDSAGLPASAITLRCAEALGDSEMGSSPEFRLFDDNVCQAVRRYATAMRGVRVEPDVSEFVWSFGRRHWEARPTQRMCAATLEDRSITAWVCNNDTLALLALDFLERAGVSVPRTLSVVGFDDTLEAFSRGLTSYNFASEATVQAALDHIISPRRRRVRDPWSAEIPGVVMVRASSGPARRDAASQASVPLVR